MAAESWKVIFRECFGRKGLEYCNELWPLIIAVDHGIKPSFLWDVCVPDTSALLSFLSTAYQKGLLEEKLRVVEIGLDVFIVNISSVIQSLTRILTSEDTWLIDISGSEPKIPNKDIHFHFRDHLVSLLSQLGVSSCNKEENDTSIEPEIKVSANSEEAFSPTTDNTVSEEPSRLERNCEALDKAITINFPEGTNLSTIFGCMLGYPQIYWWQGESGGNSLSCVPLKVFKFGAFFNPNSSYVELFSFSIPESMEPQLRPGIEKWGNIQNVFVGKSATFSETKFTCDAVLCLSVAL